MARRDQRVVEGTPKTLCVRAMDQLVEWLLRKFCREDVFPKRSRWVITGKLADLLNEAADALFEAYDYTVVTQEERDHLHYLQSTARAKLMTLDTRMNQAQRVLDLNPEHFGHYARLHNDVVDFLDAWMVAVQQQFGPPTGLKHKGSDRK